MKKEQGIRLTRQRRVILEELGRVKTHPTADEVYRMVRRRMPRISLGTVYRNLETLSGRGMILRLELAGTRRRYDADTRDHCHIRCSSCGCVHDLPVKPPAGLLSAAAAATDFSVTGCRVEFTGACPACSGTAH